MAYSHALLIGEDDKLWLELAREIKCPLESVFHVDYATSCLERLRGYTISRFRCEEVALREADYPDYGKHINIHQQFIASIDNALQDCVARRSSHRHGLSHRDCPRLLAMRFQSWIEHHLVQSDMPMRVYTIMRVRSAGR